MPSRPTRRQMLGGGAALGAAGVLGGAGALSWSRSHLAEEGATVPQRVPSPVDRDPAAARDAVATTEWIRSEARGRNVRVVTVLPAGASRSRLPVCIALHGLRGNAAWWSDRGTRAVLARAWGSGVSPFAVVAVDGGDNYWHPYTAGDDPLAMLLDEVPVWLRARGLGGPEGLPTLAAGVSMGGTGALIYARDRIRQGRPLRAAAAISPGLFLDWRPASRRPFRDQADWAAYDPMLFYPELAATPTGIWCGDRDQFTIPTKRYIEMARPEVGKVSPGRHDGTYYASVLPDVAGFLGRHVRAAAVPASLPSLRAPFGPVG